jgi:hypothetical protein
MQHCPACGVVLEKRRSLPQHRRFHALVAAARMHWPEGHWFRPKSDDHMRYWLTVQAGRFDVEKNIRVRSVEPEALLALLTAVMSTSRDEQQFVEADGDLIIVKRAHSIKFKSMPQNEFAKLCDEVEAVIASEGMDPQQLLKETASAA